MAARRPNQFAGLDEDASVAFFNARFANRTTTPFKTVSRDQAPNKNIAVNSTNLQNPTTSPQAHALDSSHVVHRRTVTGSTVQPQSPPTEPGPQSRENSKQSSQLLKTGLWMSANATRSHT